MASHYQTETSAIQRVESITQQHANNSDGVNLSTQLSLGDSYNSPPTTSAHLKFSCQTNTNSNGNLLFPLAVKNDDTVRHAQKISWHVLLKYIKSQRIIKNIEIFKKLKRKQKNNLNSQQFPIEVRRQLEKGEFPYRKDYNLLNLKRKEIELKNLKFPFKLIVGKITFPCFSKGIEEKNQNQFEINGKNYKIHQLTSSKLKPRLKLKQRTFRKLPKDSNLKRFPCSKNINCKTNKKFPLQENANSFYSNHETNVKFPQKTLQNKGKFPLENKPQNNEINCNILIKESLNTLPNVTYCEVQHCNQIAITKFPCKLFLKKQLAKHCCLLKFPVICNNAQLEYSFNNNYNILDEEKNFKNCLPSLSMMQTIQNIDNEHVFQVQDAQMHVEEIPQSLTTTANKRPPPQAAIAKTIYGKADGVHINSINNTTRPNEVGYYAEKIERLQDAIVALFARIQNSLTTNHNIEHESTNAAKHDYGADNIRFALTPPMSLTSVLNTERNHNEDVLHKKYDLGDDLCERQDAHIVECSEVHDTLAETVDYGVTKEHTNSTGSILVKSEETTSPNSLAPCPLNETERTSSKYYTNASELLPKYNVFVVNEKHNVKDIKDYLEFDPNKLTRESEDTVINTCENSLVSANVNEMTVTHLTGSEQENTNVNNHLLSNESLEHKNNILCNDLQIDEMKFEMNKVKGALPSSVSQRSLGKQDNLTTGTENGNYGRHTGTSSARLSTDTSISNNRLPYSLNSIRNHNDSPYTTSRSSLKNESNTIVPRHSTLSAYLPQDGIVRRSLVGTSASNEATASRAALDPMKTSNDFNIDTPSHRRLSLGALRSTQSTSHHSVDLPHYSPLTTANQVALSNRAVSIDSSLGDVLPEKTRLRRQRRLRTQDSQDEPEDAIERLNRLKARISASLSEVKGVLKQYSTDAENENDNQTAAAATVAEGMKADEEKEGPVTFRFVKKIRRRIIFDDEDKKEQNKTETNEQTLKEITENHFVKQLEVKDETDNCKLVTGCTLPTKSSDCVEDSKEKALENRDKEDFTKKVIETPLLETSELKLNTHLYTLKEEVQEPPEYIKETESERRPKLRGENENNKNLGEELGTPKVESKGTIPKQTIKTLKTNKSDNDSIPETGTKTKKKIIIKSKDHNRRASLAAVEGSKIEPAVELAIPATIHRRPSDSEAVVKKKLITAKINTSGVVEEVTPKPKIVKLKKSSIKSNNNSQLAATQTNQKANYKSDDHVKPIDKDNKSIDTDKNKDVLMPKPAEQQQQNNIKIEITRQTNSLLPTQLVIDDAASLNKKTIKNSVLPPRQQQQQQLEQDQQATRKPTATNFKSNDLPAKGAMLENVATVLSSPTDSEANGQIKRENIVQPENLYDLLQQETAIIKPFTSSKQNELKQLQQGEERSKAKDIFAQQAPTEKSNRNLESDQTTATTKLPQQQKSPTQYQQVIATTDVSRVKSEDDSKKHDDIKAKPSLKEPCIDKTTTSTHVGVEHYKQQKQHQQLPIEDEQPITNVVDTKTISSPHISISSTSDIAHRTTTAIVVEKKPEAPANQQTTMPELQLTPAPVQTARVNSHPEHHKKKIIIKKIVRQLSTDKSKKTELEKTRATQNAEPVAVEKLLSSNAKPTQGTEHNVVEPPSGKSALLQVAKQLIIEPASSKPKSTQETDQVKIEPTSNKSELTQTAEHIVVEPATSIPALPQVAKQVIIAPASNKPKSTQETDQVKLELAANKSKSTQETVPVEVEPRSSKSTYPQETKQAVIEPPPNQSKPSHETEQIAHETTLESAHDEELLEDYSETTEISESSASIDSQEVEATQTPTKERKVKKKVIIKRQKRRLSIGDSFFHPGNEDESQCAEIETLEKPIAYVSDEESEQSDKKDEEAEHGEEQKEEKKPLKSCILHKEYNIGDEVLYGERVKKTQIKWLRGRIKERITSISYLLDINGKDVSSHINYLKRYTGRKVSFGGKEYLEIDYEQLAEEEEKAERLQKRTYSIWNMV